MSDDLKKMVIVACSAVSLSLIGWCALYSYLEYRFNRVAVENGLHQKVIILRDDADEHNPDAPVGERPVVFWTERTQ